MIENGPVKIHYEEANPYAEKPIHLALRGESKDLVIGLIRIAVNIAKQQGYTAESMFDCIKGNYIDHKDFFDGEKEEVK